MINKVYNLRGLNKIKSIIRLILLVILILVNFINTAHALSSIEIDLSSLSGSESETSHNHIWIESYDSNNHWQECQICKQEKDKIKHSLSTSYTMGSATCSVNNRKIIKCNSCGYSVLEQTGLKHTFDRIQNNVFYEGSEEYYAVASVCANCEGSYYRSYKDTFKYSDGTIVNEDNIVVNKTIIDPDNNSGKISWKYAEVSTDDSNCEYSYSFSSDYSEMYVNMSFDVPQRAYEWFSTDKFTNTTYVIPTIWASFIHKDYISTSQRFTASNIKYDATNKKITCKITLPLRDYKKDYSNGSISTALYLYNGSMRARYSTPTVQISTNFIDPIINNAGV